MTNKFLHLKALQRIIDEQKDFQVVLERLEKSMNLSNEMLSSFRHCVLGTLRHFYALQYEVETAIPDLIDNSDIQYLMILALFDIRYRKKEIALYQVIDQVNETIDYMDIDFDKEYIGERLDYLGKNNLLNKYKLEKVHDNSSFEDLCRYYEIIFNIPVWLLKELLNDLGDDKCMRILKSSLKSGHKYLCSNKLLSDKDKFNSDKRFTAIDFDSSMYEYKNGPVVKLDEVINGELFVLDLSLAYLASKIKVYEGNSILYVSEVYSSLPCKIAIDGSFKHVKVDCLFDLEKDYARLKNLNNRLDVKNIKSYIGNVDIMLTYSEYENYDTVIINPLSSSLGQIGRRPDILLTLSEKDVGFYGRQDLKRLIEASKFVCKGGDLIYFVPTYTRKETTDVINKFLATKNDFVLDSSYLLLPDEYNSDGLFYALLKRRG